MGWRVLVTARAFWISGQEAPEELSRFQPDVFDEAPVLVVWQVGTNAVYHDYNPAEVAAAIEVGLQWLAGFAAKASVA